MVRYSTPAPFYAAPCYLAPRHATTTRRQRPMPSLVRIGSVDVRLGDGADENLNDYSLSKAAPTMETVEEVIQLFESGGTVRGAVRRRRR